jgi:hypothetical protein
VHWVVQHPRSYWLIALVICLALAAAESLTPARRFALFPVPSANPANWLASIAITFREYPLLASAIFVIPPVAIVIFLVSRRAAG